jgi:hypothetical protein
MRTWVMGPAGLMKPDVSSNLCIASGPRRVRLTRGVHVAVVGSKLEQRTRRKSEVRNMDKWMTRVRSRSVERV